MVMEGDKAIREHIKESIPWESMELELAAEASEGEEAMALFMQYEPHIVLTDINIPLIDGMELARRFAEREKDLADVVLQVIVNSNMEKVQKWKGSERIMCEALRVLMADELNEGRVAGQREGRVEGQREGQIRAYASLVQDGIITVETGAEKAGMSVDDFTKEMKQAGYVIPAV